MKIYQRVIKQLEQLVAKGPQQVGAVMQKSPQGYIVGVPAGGNEPEASLNVQDYDRYSVILRHLEVAGSETVANDRTKDYLQRCAAEISGRVTYLEEPLALLELDAQAGIAQLRSSPPERRSGESVYWELTVWAAPHPRARLTRYRWTADSDERHSVPHPLTFVTLARIAEDLAASLVENSDE